MKLYFYGQSADWVHRREMSFVQPAPAPIEDVLRGHSELRPILEHRDVLLVSVNCGHAEFDTAVSNEDEVAFLPPFAL